MTNVLSNTQVILNGAGYVTRQTSISKISVLCFEDEVISGFVYAFSSSQELIREWKSTETTLLKHFASSLRGAGDKSWNIYCIFLCSSAATADEKRRVSRIEENLERTRKIAATELISRDDLIRALLPILPVQSRPTLDENEVTARFITRINDIAPAAAQAILDTSISAEDVFRLLGAPNEN